MTKERQDRSPSNDIVSLYPRIQVGTDNTLPARLGTNRVIKLLVVRGGGGGGGAGLGDEAQLF